MHLFLISIIGALGGFQFGYDMGLISDVLPLINEQLNLSVANEQLVVAMMWYGACLGPFLGAFLMLKFGRRYAISTSSVFFIIGALLMALSWNLSSLLIGRWLRGLGSGVSAASAPVYLGELAPTEIRGAMVITCELMISVSVVIAPLVDFTLPPDWKLMVAIPIVPATFMFFLSFLLPESPRWLVMHGRLQEAMDVTLSIYKSYTNSDRKNRKLDTNEPLISYKHRCNKEMVEIWSSVHKEINEIQSIRSCFFSRLTNYDQKKYTVSNPCNEIIEKVQGIFNNNYQYVEDTDKIVAFLSKSENVIKSKVGLRTLDLGNESIVKVFTCLFQDMIVLFTTYEARPLILCIVLAIFNQACASNTIIDYAPTMLNNLGGLQIKYAVVQSTVIGVAKTVGIVIGVWLIDRVGRRPLITVGSLLCTVSMVTLSWSGYIGSWQLALLAMSLFILSFSSTLAGSFWVILSEFFSIGAKSPAVSLSASVLFLVGALTNTAFLSVYGWFGCWSFLVFGGITFANAAFVICFLPETKGKSLNEIQRMFGRKSIEDELKNAVNGKQEFNETNFSSQSSLNTILFDFV